MHTQSSNPEELTPTVAQYSVILADTHIQYRMRNAYSVRSYRRLLAQTLACRIKPDVGVSPQGAPERRDNQLLHSETVKSPSMQSLMVTILCMYQLGIGTSKSCIGAIDNAWEPLTPALD